MPVSTASAAIHITPTVLKTFISHGERKAARMQGGNKDDHPQDDILYDQAFHIVKSFINFGCQNTVESLQSFTNTHIPSPYGASVAPILIPLSSCNAAADVLKEWFGPEELMQVVGGERWWQVRGLDGIDAEWITDKRYLSDPKDSSNGQRKYFRQEDIIPRMEHLEPVMLYIHGGGYFWGSITGEKIHIGTKSYAMVNKMNPCSLNLALNVHTHLARKFHGRAFAVNYRKAPQYPWPCAIQDVLAAYLYLIDPPGDAPHKAILPNKITLAGDSAGGGLCLSLLTILRDLGRPLPAGAVLISPWVDLTHSFPSILENGDTDIIPDHGFLSKPSTLWPLDLLPPEGGRIATAGTNPPPMPGEADTLKPSQSRMCSTATGGEDSCRGVSIQTQEEMLSSRNGVGEHEVMDQFPVESSPLRSAHQPDPREWEPKPPKILMQDPHSVPVELRSQIQLYATTEQLTHPLVSPVFQGSLGNLPPLYIIGGDGEVLRDEISYLAHRGADPQTYPTRKSMLRDARRQRENVERFTKGTKTKVHFQLFDGMCHVPTVFSFAPNARYAYRAIAAFVMHVTQLTAEELEHTPFPEHQLERPRPGSSQGPISKDTHQFDTPTLSTRGLASRESDQSSHAAIQEHSNVAIMHMRRERVSVQGHLRIMEPVKDITALNLPTRELGILKEAPVMKWKKGQDEWDRRFKRAASRALKKRQKLQLDAEKILKNAFDQGLIHSSLPPGEANSDEASRSHSPSRPANIRQTSIGQIQLERRWGPLDLENETPPLSAIAKRQDTPEALALLKKHVYFTAPVTHQSIPKMKHVDALRASVDPHDDPNRPPKQSVSEEQQTVHILPVHGLRLWDNIITYFGRKSTAKAANGTKLVGERVKNIMADKLEQEPSA